MHLNKRSCPCSSSNVVVDIVASSFTVPLLLPAWRQPSCGWKQLLDDIKIENSDRVNTENLNLIKLHNVQIYNLNKSINLKKKASAPQEVTEAVMIKEHNCES